MDSRMRSLIRPGAARAARCVGMVLGVAMGVLSGELAAQLPEVLEAGSDPVPVLLVPGWGDEAPDLKALRTRFVEAGWPEGRVNAVDFDDAFGSNEEHASEIGAAIRVLQGITGTERVDVVAHSMGGLALRQYLKDASVLDDAETDPVLPIRRAVFLGTPHRGTVVAMLAWGDGGREMVPGSDFLMQLNEVAGVPAQVEALSLRTPLDLRVIPASSGLLGGERVLNLELCCPTHNQLVDDDETFHAVLRFLLLGPGSMDDAEGVDPPRPK